MWREDPQQPLKDYRMTRLKFGVSALPFAAIMAMRQNAMDHQRKYHLAAQAVMNDFYVDNSLNGADSIDEAIKVQSEMQELLNLEDLCSESGSQVNHGPHTNTSRAGRQSVYSIHRHRPLHQGVRYGMEHHFRYLLTSGFIAEAGRDTNQASIAVGHSKSVRYLGLVSSSDCQAEDSPPTHGGKK